MQIHGSEHRTYLLFHQLQARFVDENDHELGHIQGARRQGGIREHDSLHELLARTHLRIDEINVGIWVLMRVVFHVFEGVVVTVVDDELVRQNGHFRADVHVCGSEYLLVCMVGFQFAAGQKDATLVTGVTLRRFTDLKCIVFEMHLNDEFTGFVSLL